MKARTMIRNLLAEQGVSVKELSDRVGANAYSSVVNVFNTQVNVDLSIGNTVRFANALGYKVIVAPKAEVDEKWRISNED